tara:strand:+ start:1729 stop:2085 length:357 start_codon:yes stop_codon:yes gene_type:complete
MKNKHTISNLMNEHEDLVLKNTEYQMEDSYADHGYGLEEELYNKRKEIGKLLGGGLQYGGDGFEGILSIIHVAKEVRQWKEYAWWLEEKLAEAEGVEEDEYFHKFFEWFNTNKRWDKE